MATVIKSNQAATDINGIFPYVSDFGATTQSLGRYAYERELAGSPITQTEHNALKALEDSLVSIGVFDKIIEFIPLMGKNLNSMLLKYKFKDNDRMVGINGFSASNLNLGLGLNFLAPSGTMPALNMKLKQKYLTAKGLTSFIYYNSPVNAAVTTDRTIFGVGSTDADEVNTVQFVVDAIRRINAKYLGAGVVFSDKLYHGKFLLAQKTGFNTSGQVTVRELYDNGTLAASMSGTVTLAGSTMSESEIYVGAKNGATSGGTKFFYGQIRFILLFDGTVDALLIPQINTALQTFISQTGKTL